MGAHLLQINHISQVVHHNFLKGGTFSVVWLIHWNIHRYTISGVYIASDIFLWIWLLTSLGSEEKFFPKAFTLNSKFAANLIQFSSFSDFDTLPIKEVQCSTVEDLYDGQLARRAIHVLCNVKYVSCGVCVCFVFYLFLHSGQLASRAIHISPGYSICNVCSVCTRNNVHYISTVCIWCMHFWICKIYTVCNEAYDTNAVHNM